MKIVKKFFLYAVMIAVALLCLGLTSCNDPVKPKIIGTGNLCFFEDYYYVEINSTKYFVDNVIFKKQYDEPAQMHIGMKITVFTTAKHNKTMFIAGEKNVEEIEQAFAQNFKALFFCGCCFGLLILFIATKLNRNELTPLTRTLI